MAEGGTERPAPVGRIDGAQLAKFRHGRFPIQR
jgi:hypothetical protein